MPADGLLLALMVPPGGWGPGARLVRFMLPGCGPELGNVDLNIVEKVGLKSGPVLRMASAGVLLCSQGGDRCP